ncbi:MAG: response regulator [Desulfosalsimonas sp.]
MNDEEKKINDWMARISFEGTQSRQADHDDDETKTKLALDKIMVVRDQKTQERKNGETEEMGEKTGDKTERELLNIMILDDEPIVGKRLTPALTRAGFEVEFFLDPKQALARLDEKEFDIVVTDLKMEEVDGIQVLEHILSRCRNTRVILITGYATVEVAREALVKGAFDFIAKPFKPGDLKAVINKAALSLGHKGVVCDDDVM